MSSASWAWLFCWPLFSDSGPASRLTRLSPVLFYLRENHLEFRVMELAKGQNCGQTFGYASTRTSGAVPPAIVSKVHPPRDGLDRAHRRRGPGGASTQPGRTELGHAAPLVL